jgi:hypothetical protein
VSQNQSLNEGRIQPDDGFQDYLVSWEIEVSAQSPWEAAEFAQRIQRDPSTTSNVFVVDGITIDLDEPGPHRTVCPECGARAVTAPTEPKSLPVCLACDWTGWITADGTDTGA